MSTTFRLKKLKFLIIGLSIFFIIVIYNSAKACDEASFASNITLTDTWQLYDSIKAGTYYIAQASANDVILVSFCQAGAFFENNPMVEISAISGTQFPKSNDDFCGYGSELIFICETTGTYKIAFYQSDCIADGASLGTMAIKLVRTPTVQDCLGAIPLCSEFYEDTVSVSGSGNYYDIYNFNEQEGMTVTTNNCPNCLVTGEMNAKWFTFQIHESGSLAFVINPFNDFDDYDWALYKLNDTIGCESLISPYTIPPIRCNFSFFETQSGNTGLGSGMTECEGPDADQGFTTNLLTSIGEKFVLVVSNFSSTQDGFSIDFSPSEALIIDTTPPRVSSIVYDIQCGSSIINLQFSENILCNEVQSTDFVLNGPEGNCQINNIYSNISIASSVNTYSGVFYHDIWTLVLESPLDISGQYTLTLAENMIFDNCLNPNNDTTLSFDIVCPDFYTLTVNTAGEGFVEVNEMPQAETYTIIGNTNLQVLAIPELGWQFDSWSGDLSGTNNSQNILIDGNKTITATFTELPAIYDTLTVNIEGMGHIEVNGNLYTDPLLVERYSSPSLFAIADFGWQFDHWEDSLTGNINPKNLSMLANEMVTAVFTEIPTYNLEIAIIGQGNIEVNGALYESIMSFEENFLIELNALGEEGWQFDHWENSLSGAANPISFNIYENQYISAVFSEIPIYNLEIDVVGQGSVNVNGALYESILSFEENSTVQIFANAADGWYFSNWTDSVVGGGNPKNININCNKFITAVFYEWPDYNLEINVVGMGGVEVNGNLYEDVLSFEIFTGVELFAIPDDGWQFSHWQDSLDGNLNPDSVFMFYHRNVTAVFIEAPEYYLYVDETENGEIEINNSIYESPLLIEEGSLLSIKAIPFENYMFGNWTGDLSGTTNPVTVLMESELSIGAVFLNISSIEQFNNYKYSISPNPFKESLKITSNTPDKETIYHLYSTTGSLILKGSFFGSKTISTDFLEPALYKLCLFNEEVRQEFKIIKTE